jgi:hypothetical protein
MAVVLFLFLGILRSAGAGASYREATFRAPSNVETVALEEE